MQHLVSAASVFWLGLTGFATAQNAVADPVHPVVVELYTSQGCSSCPPADAFMTELAHLPGVIALSLHVDYWDYIGWKDTFANPKFTNRQKSYAKAAGSRMIYTPQMIVEGVDRVEGNDPVAVTEALRKHQLIGSPVRLSVLRGAADITIRVEAEPPLQNAARIQLVRYLPEARVMIERGENAGQEVTYTNIVTAWEPVADWSGASPLETTAPLNGAEPVVVIVQSEGMGEVLAAAQLP